MFFSKSIRSAIYFISVVLISVIVIQGAYTYYGSTSIKYSAEMVEKHILPASGATQHFLSLFEKMQLDKAKITSGSDLDADVDLSDFKDLSDSAKIQIGAIIKYYQGGDGAESLVKKTKLLQSAFGSYTDLTSDVLDKFAHGNSMEVLPKLKDVKEKTTLIKNLVEDIAKENKQITEGNFSGIKNLAKNFLWVVIAIFVVLLGVVGGFLTYIRRLVNSIRNLASDANQIRAGNLNHKVVWDREDEMGDLQSDFDKMRLEVKDHIENLDKKVQERTAEVVEEKKKVSSLLNNMKQAVLKIDVNLSIIPPVSAYATEVFGQEVVGKSIFDTLYSDLAPRSEEKVALDTAFIAVFGEGDLQWDLSCDGLLQRVERQKNGETQVLKVSYAPLWDKDDNLEEIMMVIEDITELERLAIEKRKNEERIAIIQEISQVSLNDLRDYFTSSTSLIRDVQHQIDNDQWDLESLGLMFRSLHTLKGNSRVFGLTSIGTAAHDVETYVGQATALVRAKEGVSDSIIEAIQSALFATFAKLNSYADVANKFFKLGVDLRTHLLENIQRDMVLVLSKMQSEDLLPLQAELSQALSRISRNCGLLDGVVQRDLAAKLNVAVSNADFVNLKIGQEALSKSLLQTFGEEMSPLIVSDKQQVAQLVIGLVELTTPRSDSKFKSEAQLEELEIFGEFSAFWSLKDTNRLESIHSLLAQIALHLAFDFKVTFEATERDVLSSLLQKGDQEGVDHWLNRPQLRSTLLSALTHLASDEKIGFPKVFDYVLTQGLGISIDHFFDLVAELDLEMSKNAALRFIAAGSIRNQEYSAKEGKSFLDKIITHSIPEFTLVTIYNANVVDAQHLRTKLFEGGELRQNVNVQKLKTLEKVIGDLLEGRSGASLVGAKRIFDQLPYADVRSAFNRYRSLVADLAKNLGKSVKFELLGEDVALPQHKLPSLLDSIVHLVRNSLDHGLEKSEDRVSVGKESTGLLRIHLQENEKNVIITIEDDGAGIDSERIYQRALEKGLLDREVLSAQDKLNLIFLPGFSTKEQVTDLSGRGVGMDVVKRNVTEALGGNLSMESVVGKFTKFILEIPI